MKLPPLSSVIKPSAPNAILCEADIEPERNVIDIQLYKEQIIKGNRMLWYIIELMWAGGLRVSEALQIKSKNITSSGHILIKGLKNSSNRIIYSNESKAYLLYCKKTGVAPFADYNRFFVYREFIKYGIILQNGRNNKQLVTHSIRHSVALSQQYSGIDINETSIMLGHKNKKNTEYYRKK